MVPEGGSELMVAAEAAGAHPTMVMHLPQIRRESDANPRNRALQNAEFQFIGTLSAATILVRRGLAVDAGETDGNCASRVDTAKTRVVFSISCCSAQPPANPSSTPTTARPPSIRFSSSYLLPNQQVRDGPACKQDCQVSIKTRTRPGAGFFVSEPFDFPPPLRVAFHHDPPAHLEPANAHRPHGGCVRVWSRPGRRHPFP